MKSKRIAVIGTGPSGLAAIKSCKEVGFEPVCYERNADPGGLWKFRDEVIDGVASVTKSTVINTSKEQSAFSDFPPPEDYPNFMHHSQLYNYFMMYAKHFDLLRHIRCNSEVIKVEKTEDHEATGRWIVSVKNSKTAVVTKDTFDAVLVCIGHHVFPKVPNFPGQENFNGIIMHSHSVKSYEQFSGKRVVVVGIGNSGADNAVDSTHHAKKVYLSTRRGCWIFSRVGIKGRPYDMDFVSRKKILIRSFVPYNVICNQIEKALNEKFDHEAYKLKPKHRVLSCHPTLNDCLPYCILSGRVIIKGDIERFEKNGVLFADEDEVTEADVVILATGYLIKFPFLGDLVATKENKVNLYKYVIPPTLKHPTLALIGLIQPIGPIFPVAEMQCRWFMQLLLGNIKLPSPEAMQKEIKAKIEANVERYIGSTRHTIQAEWGPYMDELASMFGAKPNMLKMAITDPRLFSNCFNGPILSYQFRLQGPFAWSGARDAILNYEKRVFHGLNSEGRGISLNKEKNSKKLLLIAVLLAGIIVFKKHLCISFGDIINTKEI